MARAADIRRGLIPWLALVVPALAATPAHDADREIGALVAALEQSPCRFQRNGSWYDAPRAAAHLQRKYDYLRKRGMAGDAEQFIARAASTSSVSGRPYRVACPGASERDAGPWFRERLQQLRHHPGAG